MTTSPKSIFQQPGRFVWFLAFAFCIFAACDACGTNPVKEPVVPDADGKDNTSREAMLEASRESSKTLDDKASDASADGSLDAIAPDLVPEPRPWENRPITPWDGPSLEGGLPDNYAFEKRGQGFAQRVVTFTPAKGASHGHGDFPARLLGPPRGLGDAKGSLHVVSLGCGGSIVLEFSSPLIANGPGPDFVIFENAFFPGGGKETFSEPAQVSVSIDGKRWYAFPCQPDNTPWPHPKCAGINPVYANPSDKDNKIDPYDPTSSGGDAFDLSDVKLPFARFVKIEDRSQLSPDASVWCGSYNAGFDLDAVAVLWGYRP